MAIADSAASGNYSMGILLDGEVYHNTQTTRDREIVQPTVLNMLGWKIMRVWSVDWINNPERVIARIENALQQKSKPTETPVSNATFDVAKEKVEEIESYEKEYRVYNGLGKTDSMSDEVLATKILSCEQPMTLMYLCRCMCAHRDNTRVTPTLLASVKDIADRQMFVQTLGNSTILWTDKEHADAFSGYRQAHGRDITEIPLIERHSTHCARAAIYQDRCTNASCCKKVRLCPPWCKSRPSAKRRRRIAFKHKVHRRV